MATGNLLNAGGALIVDYTTRDYLGFKNDLTGLITTKVPEWTNVVESDFGIVLIELFCYLADSLAYYQDRIANESFLPTAQLRQSVINLCALIGYELAGPEPAGVTLTFTVPSSTNPQTIPAGSVISTQGSSTSTPIYFTTDIALTITAGNTTGTVTATQGQMVTEIIGSSDGSPQQTFQLSQIPVVQSSIVIAVNEGAGYVVWNLNENLISALPTDLSYSFSVGTNGIVTIQFGDGISGKIPNSGATIQATYRNGGGLIGIVGANTITQLISCPAFVSSVTNPAGSNGAADPESIAHAQAFAPATFARQNRAVSLSDYITIAQGYPGVQMAGVTTSVLDGVVQVGIYVMPTGGGIPTNEFLDSLVTYIAQYAMLSVNITAYSAVYLNVLANISVTVQNAFSQNSVQSAITTAIDNFFAPGNLAFAQPVELSVLYALIQNIPGVQYCLINELSIYPLIIAGTQHGNPTFSAVTITSAITAEIWTVTMTDATHFTVSGSVSGSQPTGTFGTAYSITSGGLNFTILAGTTPASDGDSWTIQTMVYNATIIPSALQVAILETLTLNMSGGT